MKLLIFTAPAWCAPCRELEKHIDDIKALIETEVYDIDTQTEVATKYDIRGVPSFLLVENDKEIKRITGLSKPSRIQEWINS